MIKKIIILLLLGLYVLINVGFTENSENNFIYIFDASGSMAQDMGSRTKFEIAKEVLIEHVEDLSSNVGVGMLYFGNETKGKKRISYAIPVDVERQLFLPTGDNYNCRLILY